MPNPYMLLGEYRDLITWVAIAASLASGLWVNYHGREIKERVGQSGILALEFTMNRKNANEVITNLAKPTPDPKTEQKQDDRDLRPLAAANIWWDFLFIVAYVASTAFVCGYAATDNRGWWGAVLLALAWLQLAAGTLDVVENGCMLRMLDSTSVSTNLLPSVTTLCATLKFLIVFGGAGAGVPSAAVKLVGSCYK